MALVIRGIFPPKDHLLDLDLGMDTAFANLPGFWSPFLKESSIANIAQAFDAAMKRKPHVLGVSVGGLVGLAMKNAASVTAVDPPFQTGPLWPITGFTRRFVYYTKSEEFKAWALNVLGYTHGGVENRDYRSLVDEVSVPATVVMASVPLEPERPGTKPGLITAEDRDWLRAHPKVRVVEAPCGHDIPQHWREGMIEAFRSSVAASE